MKVLVLAPSFWPAVDAGGPARSLSNLVREVATGHEVVVVAADRDVHSPEPFDGLSGRRISFDGAEVFYVDSSSPAQIVSVWRIVAHEHYDLVVLSGIWSLKFSFIPALLRRLGLVRARTVVLCPRGELESGALALKALKKRVAAGTVRSLCGHAVDVFAGTSHSERENIRRWWPDAMVISMSNSSDFVNPRLDSRPCGTSAFSISLEYTQRRGFASCLSH